MGNYSSAQWLFLTLVFFVAAGTPFGIYLALRRGAVQRRLDRVLGVAPEVEARERREKEAGWIETITKAATPLARLSVPDEGWETSQLRRRLIQAGLRNPNAPVLFFAIKSALALLLPLGWWGIRIYFDSKMETGDFLAGAALLCAIGFYAPNMLLNRMQKSRQLEIFENFPDALDLLTICVEAGLSLEAALNRVAAEIQINSPTLAEELQLVCLEFRAGSGKDRALRNLALRTGVEDIDTLVAMLVQSEKFGTSIGESLRIHSEMLRVKRQQRAEEQAAKVAVKLTFPLVLCIFPCILIVVAGPAMISIFRTLPGMIGG